MITILFDNISEVENLRDFFAHKHGCVDFSDALEECSGSCAACREHFFQHNVISRHEYADCDPYIKDGLRTCDTCDNLPICWLSSTAAYPYPCKHYRRATR